MSEERPIIGSERWRTVDTTQDPGSFVSYLDRGADVLRQLRVDVIRALEVSPGSFVLDVGSGAGEFLIEVASAVDSVTAVGIDVSKVMVETAASRAQSAGVDLKFQVGDAQRLDFPTDLFDCVNCSRVLVHLEDPAAAVAEMARVLKPGGRVAIIEPDFDSLMIDSDDLEVARAVRRELSDGLRNPDIGRRLHRLLVDYGLQPLDVMVMARNMPSLTVVVDSFGLFDHLDNAVRAGSVTAEAAGRWRTWLEAADASGRLFIAGILVRALATKPTG